MIIAGQVLDIIIAGHSREVPDKLLAEARCVSSQTIEKHNEYSHFQSPVIQIDEVDNTHTHTHTHTYIYIYIYIIFY